MWNQVNATSWSAIGSTPVAFTLRGGAYGITLHATTWGTATLQRKTPDGGFVTVLTAFSADGYQTVNLPNGTYQLLLSGITALSGDIVSIVQDQ
jgi:hypothetical protein